MLKRLTVVFLATLPLQSTADTPAYVVQAYPKVCKHGLYEQPTKEFSVFLFCDDAQGSNIGVILTRAGVGPVEGEPAYKWGTAKRFWQSGPWVTDVMSFTWSQSGRFLYVATSPIYGDGGLFELDLIMQEWRRVIPETSSSEIKRQFKGNYYTKIDRVDLDRNIMSVGIYELSADKEKRIAVQEIKTK
jgi:hypothetical protein